MRRREKFLSGSGFGCAFGESFAESHEKGEVPVAEGAPELFQGFSVIGNDARLAFASLVRQDDFFQSSVQGYGFSADESLQFQSLQKTGC